MEREDNRDAPQVHPGDSGKRPPADAGDFTIRWLCYEEYPLSDPADSDTGRVGSEEGVMLD